MHVSNSPANRRRCVVWTSCSPLEPARSSRVKKPTSKARTAAATKQKKGSTASKPKENEAPWTDEETYELLRLVKVLRGSGYFSRLGKKRPRYGDVATKINTRFHKKDPKVFPYERTSTTCSQKICNLDETYKTAYYRGVTDDEQGQEGQDVSNAANGTPVGGPHAPRSLQAT
ncbi:hypothetical protein WJX79_007709 [Trebouxia sp. C0005]